MYSRFLSLAALAALACGPARAATTMRELRVCADPNNMPFSNQQQQGFENRIAELVARDLNARLSYVWYAQRRGFARNTLAANKCDVFIGVTSSLERVTTTVPYYRSTYVFATRRDREIKLASFDDPALRMLRIGVQMIGDDFNNTPPAHALAARHIIQNVKGYSVYGDYSQPNPPARIIDAVANGDIDVAIAWGPLAGYFAPKQKTALTIVPVSPAADPQLPFTFSIAMGVRKSDEALRDEIDAALVRKQAEVNKILDQFGIPRVSEPLDNKSTSTASNGTAAGPHALGNR